MNNVYPSIEELMPEPLLNLLPGPLAADVAARYLNLGEKYLTDALHTDGRRINGMMYTDRVVNANEEIIDAVFCMLGQIFKDTSKGMEPRDNIYVALELMIKLYQILKLEEQSGYYN